MILIQLQTSDCSSEPSRSNLHSGDRPTGRRSIWLWGRVGEHPFVVFHSFARLLNLSRTSSSFWVSNFSLFLLSLQVVILSQNCRNISESEAPSHILGYSLSNDVSARRDMFAVPQWGLGKSFDNWFPMGPCIVSPKMLGDPENVQLRTVLNGKEMQNDSTKNIYGRYTKRSLGWVRERLWKEEVWSACELWERKEWRFLIVTCHLLTSYFDLLPSLLFFFSFFSLRELHLLRDSNVILKSS